MHDIHPYLPELFNQPGSLLYIGARADAHSWLYELKDAGHLITVLEVWAENVYGLMGNVAIYDLVQGDVRQVNEIFENKFDYVFWWHGPEHLLQSQITETIEKLEAKTNKLIALACPYGIYPQGAHGRNPHEVHLSSIYPNFFEWLGYEVATDGAPDVAGGEIVAWKRM